MPTLPPRLRSLLRLPPGPALLCVLGSLASLPPNASADPGSPTDSPGAGSRAEPGSEPIEAQTRGAEGESPPAGPDLRPPELITFVEAEAPEQARSRGAEVQLRLDIDALGHVRRAEVVAQTGDGFETAAQTAARQLRFFPALRDGVPVASRILFTYTFPAPGAQNGKAAPGAEATPEPAGDQGPGAAPGDARAVPGPALVEVTVRAPSAGERLQHSSRAVRVIDTREAQRESADLGQVLTRSEGVNVQRAGGLGSAARISLNGLSGARVPVFIDGVPLRLSGYTAGLANVPIAFVDRLDIYRGVVPTRLGAEALGGAIELVTDARLAPGSHAAASYQTGSFDTHRLAAQAHHRGDAGWYARSRFFLDHARNDYPIQVEAPDAMGRPQTTTVDRFHDAYAGLGARAEVGLSDPADAKQLALETFYTRTDRELQNNLLGRVPYGEVTYGTDGAGAQLRFDQGLNEHVRLKGAAGYALTRFALRDLGTCRYDWFGRCANPLPTRGELEPFARDQYVVEHAPFLRADLSWALDERHALRLSIAPTYATRHGDNRALEPDAYDAVGGHRSVLGGVLGLEHRATLWSGRLENTLFVKGYLQRVDAEEQLPNGNLRDATRLEGRPGAGDSVRIRLTPWLRLKTSYEYATRLPGTEELFGDGGQTLANVALRPETGHNVNLGLEGDRLWVGFGQADFAVNGFARLVDDLIFEQGETFLEYQNMLAARILGVDARAGWRSPRDIVELRGTFTWQDPRNASHEGLLADRRDDRIPFRPYMFASGAARLRWPRPFTATDALSLTWRLRYVHPFLLEWESIAVDDPLRVGEQLTHSLVLVYVIEREERALSGSVEVQNLSDAHVFDLYGVQRPGRAAYATFTFAL